MTLGEKLLALSAEYLDVSNRENWGTSEGVRTHAEIATEYEDTLRQFIQS